VTPDDVVLGVLVITSVGAGALGAWYLRLPARQLGRAAGLLLEILGLTGVFLVVNVAVGIAVILGLRHVIGRVASLHTINDVTLGIVSLLQALLFHAWRAAGRASDGPTGAGRRGPAR
jgi:hypothetical protein